MEATYSHEMEQMRSEMCELKSLLREQEIVNEKLMRRAMNASYGKERKNIRLCIIMAALAIPLFCALRPHFGLPLWFTVITIIFFLSAMAASWFSLKRYVSEDLLNGNLLTVAEKIVKYKRFGDNWLKFSVPFLVFWLTGFFHFATRGASPDFASGLVAGGLTGGVIATVMGIINYRQSKKRLDGILKQIDEMKE